MADSASARTGTGLLLLADISGYTSFLDAVTEAHPEMTSRDGAVPPAYPLLLSLLDVVADRLAPTFTVVQTEGDAVFAFADAVEVAGRHEAILDVIADAYVAYRERIEEARILQNHDCNACLRIGSLELKFVVHAGTYVVQQLTSRVHLAGPAVNLAHRLLKNGVTERTGLRAYAFLTDAAGELIGLPPGSGTDHPEGDPVVVTGTVLEIPATARR